MKRLCIALFIPFLIVGTALMSHAAGSLCPIIDADGYLFGASLSGKWIDCPQAAKSMHGGETYTWYGFDNQLGTAVGSKAKSPGEPCPDSLCIDIKSPDKAVIAVSSPWNPLPRKPRSQDTHQPVYEKAVRDILIKYGIKNPVVEIKRIVRCDLDGKGSDAVIINAQRNSNLDQIHPAVGDYSLVMVRRIVKGKVQTSVLAIDCCVKQSDTNIRYENTIAGVFDLNGDGVMDIVLRSKYYEGSGYDIYDCSKTKIVRVLSTGCGA